MIVVDASVLVLALAARGDVGTRARDRLAGEDLAAPHLSDLEVASAFRQLESRGKLATDQAEAALAALDELPLQRVAHLPVLSRAWQLRNNLSVYDAAYVALAEALDSPLVTADRRLASAPGLRCQVEIVA